MPNPAQAPVPLDSSALRSLADALAAEVITLLDFRQRFAPFSAEENALDLHAGDTVAWADGAVVRLHTCAEADETPLGAAEVHLVFEAGARVAMADEDRTNLCGAVAGELAAQVWARLDGLFQMCAPASRHFFATASGVLGTGVVEAFLENGVVVAYSPEALAVGVVGSTTRQFLVAEAGEEPGSWHLVVQVQFTAALRIGDARRIFAEGPGPA